MTSTTPMENLNEISVLETFDLSANLVRYAELLPGKSAFIDARTPGSHLKENYCIIGAGVAENPKQPVHIRDTKGFNVGGAGQPPGIKNSLHSHTTAEIFIIFRGEFRLYWGADGATEAVLKPGDMISIPINCFRGFEVVGAEYGFLFSFLGGDDSGGGVTWHPNVIREAESHGLVLLENGKLIDTVAGHAVPNGVNKMPLLTPAQMGSFDDYSVEEMLEHVALADHYRATQQPFAEGDFIQYNLCGSANNDYDFQIKSEDGLCVFAYRMKLGQSVPTMQRPEPEVLINLSGDTLVTLRQGSCTRQILMTKGDTLNLPQNVAYQLQCVRGESLVYSAVAGNNPTRPTLV